MKDRYYIDSSVITGCFDYDNALSSNKLLDEFITGKKIAVISDLTLAELHKIKKIAEKKILEIPTEFIEYVSVNEETDFLAKQYIEYPVSLSKWFPDAIHFAIATVYSVNAFISWDTVHFANKKFIMAYNSVNIIHSYEKINFFTPFNILENDKKI